METSFVSKIESLNSKVYNRHFCVPEKIAEDFLSNKQSRVIVNLNGILQLHAAITKNKGLYQVLLNKDNCKKLGVDIGDSIEVSIKPDDSKYGMPFPEELEACFDSDPIAFQHFESLSPGKQRNLIYIVANVKNVQSRVNKSLAICEHLVTYKGNLDFKVLNETIKKYNQLKWKIRPAT